MRSTMLHGCIGRGIAGLAAILAVAADSARAVAAERIAGPVVATVVRVIDGDTIEARVRLWLDLQLTTSVRIRGIDAPEVRGRCQTEKDLAATATRRLAEVAVGEVTLIDIAEDKFFGRVVADVRAADGTDLAAMMLADGLARPYDGGARATWCDLASLEE